MLPPSWMFKLWKEHSEKATPQQFSDRARFLPRVTIAWLIFLPGRLSTIGVPSGQLLEIWRCGSNFMGIKRMKIFNQTNSISLHICQFTMTMTRSLEASPKNLQHLEFNLLTRRIFPAPWRPFPAKSSSRLFFFRLAHLQRRFEGRDDRQNLTIPRCVGFRLDPKLASPPSSTPGSGSMLQACIASINYKREKSETVLLSKCRLNIVWLAFSILVFVFWLSIICLCFVFCGFFPVKKWATCYVLHKWVMRLPTSEIHHVSSLSPCFSLTVLRWTHVIFEYQRLYV